MTFRLSSSLVFTAAVPVVVAKVSQELALAIEGQVTVITDKVVRVAVGVPVGRRHWEPRQGSGSLPARDDGED